MYSAIKSNIKTPFFHDMLKTWYKLLGLINHIPKYFYLMNFVILTGKYFVAKCKRNGRNLLFNDYKYTLKWELSLVCLL